MSRKELIRIRNRRPRKVHMCGLFDMLRSPALVQRNAVGITITPLQFIPLERDVL